MGDDRYNLPPGFRFHPSDEELIVHFLCRKEALLPCHPDIIPDVDLYCYNPWELNGRALAADNHWYYFSQKSQERISPNGYWKHLGVEDPITSSNKTVGLKKSLIFYIGEAPTGVKTNWVMHEYHLLDPDTSSRSSRKRGKSKTVSNEWILCRVHESGYGGQTSIRDDEMELSGLDEVFLSMDDDLDDITFPN